MTGLHPGHRVAHLDGFAESYTLTQDGLDPPIVVGTVIEPPSPTPGEMKEGQVCVVWDNAPEQLWLYWPGQLCRVEESANQVTLYPPDPAPWAGRT
jgi:hypothetical protein